MRRLFISDLHLSPANPELTQLACDFLRAQNTLIDECYILGDIFNTWLGDDLVPEAFLPFVDCLKSLSAKGVRLYLMVGNRDFMLGQTFAKRVGATLIDDGYQLELGDRKAMLLHGDTLCTDDISYQRYRRIVRTPWLQWCFLHLPSSLRQRISDAIINKSKQKKQHKTAMIMDVNLAEVNSVMTSAGINLLIHGHTHRPAIHTLNGLGQTECHRVVLGDWQEGSASYLITDDQQLMLHDHRVSEEEALLRLT